MQKQIKYIRKFNDGSVKCDIDNVIDLKYHSCLSDNNINGYVDSLKWAANKEIKRENNIVEIIVYDGRLDISYEYKRA